MISAEVDRVHKVVQIPLHVVILRGKTGMVNHTILFYCPSKISILERWEVPGILPGFS